MDVDGTQLEPLEAGWNAVSKGKPLKDTAVLPSIHTEAPPVAVGWASLFETPRHSPCSRARSPAPSHTEALNVIASAEPISLSWKSLQAPCRMKMRGLLNTGNMCFLNAILQSLIHCPPLANLFRLIPTRLLESLDAPYLSAFSHLFAQFYENVDKQSKGTDPVVPDRLNDAIRITSRTEAFQGDQEDAQEFLTFVLEQLNEEFLKNRELLDWRFSGATETLFRSESVQEEAGWMEVGPKQKVSETRTLGQRETPISFLFAGQYRSTVKRPRVKDSITFEPFNCLSLEVHHRHIARIEDALTYLARAESIETGLTKHVSISRLPMILIIQLKRFVYNQTTGKIEKVCKHVSYPEKLVLPRQSYSIPQQDVGRPPTYRLVAVVYHHGRMAEGGHYTVDVRKSFKMDEPWQRINDASISPVSMETVLGERRSSADTSAYLLVYQRYKDLKHQL